MSASVSRRSSQWSGQVTRPETALSQLAKPEQLEGETKAQYAWRLIRTSVRETIDLCAQADAKDIVITHGMHHLRALNHMEKLHQIVYNKTKKEYLTLDGEVIRVFMHDGRKKDVICPEEKMNRMLHAAPLNMYIGWIHAYHEIFLVDEEFQIVSMAESDGPILALAYNHNINEIITVGPGYFTSWVFRYGGRHLLPRKTTTEGLSPQHEFTGLVLEETASRAQKAFASFGCSVAVFNVFDGKLLCWKQELHTRTITALLFFNPLKFLVTAARDGSIKVWDEKWHLQLVFVGHEGRVTSLAIYPYGPVIMSSSNDCTIRIWSLETCDEVDKVETEEPVTSLVTVMNDDNFCSLCEQHADLWKVHHIHQLHSTVCHKVWQIKSTDHPNYPVRSVLLCQDSSVRILSPISGDVITTLLMNPKRRLMDAAYAIAEDTLFAVFGNGDIIKCDTSTNPCKIVSQWSCSEPKRTESEYRPDGGSTKDTPYLALTEACNYLLVYEYVIMADIQSDTWGGVNRAITTKGLHSTSTRGANRTLLLGGRRDGHICVFDWETGDVEFEIEAHGTKGVLSMFSNSKSDQLISAGLDNIIKVWRLYPYAQESLAPLLSFYCAHTPLYMTVLRDKLAVAFQEHTTATYSIVMYNLQTKNRHDHGPEEDHMDSLRGLTSCPKMKILASCSSDGTIHIWNDTNTLVRLIKLNAQPHSLAFCSIKGDLLVGIGEHVHRIDYKAYMPRPYRFKMVSMQFPPVKSERAIPFDENTLNIMSRDDVKRLKAARSSFKFTHFMDILTEEENVEVQREKQQRQDAFEQLEQRESEIARIRDGELSAKRKPRPTQATKREAFNKYLKIFFDRPKIELYKEDPYAAEPALDGMQSEERQFIPSDQPGFFPAPSTARKPMEAKEPEHLPIQAGGFVPNSVLARLLWPQLVKPEKEKKQKGTSYMPPSMTKEQLAQIAAHNKTPHWHKPKQKHKSTFSSRQKQRDAEFREQSMFFDYGDDDEGRPASQMDSHLSTRSSEKIIEEEVIVTSAATSKPGSSLMEKMQSIMAKAPSPVPVASPEPTSRTPDSSKSAPAAAPTPPADPLPQRKPKPQRPQIVKLVSRPEPTPPPRPPPPKPVAAPPREPSPPPRPDTPLPDFIAQFIGQEWFDRYFPDCSPKTFAKPWTMMAFINMLLKAVHVAEYPHKVSLVEAIGQLQREEGIPNGHSVHQSLLSFMSSSSQAPNCQYPDQKTFIIAALNLIQGLGIWDRDFYCELITQFLEADNELRQIVLELFRMCGLRDPHGYLPRELDNWDVWNLEESERPRELRKMARQWLDKWLTSFKMHLEDAIEKLKKGQKISGHVGGRGRRDNRPKSILRKPNISSIEESGEDDRTGGATSTQPSSPASSSKLVTVTFDKAPDATAIENATYLEALNYFCEMELEREMERMRRPHASRMSQEETRSAEEKNTVLVLPKIPGRAALVRLGETHTSKCRPQRETVFADLTLPPIIAPGKRGDPGFPTAVNLPLKTCYMNPFPSPLDELEQLANQPLLLTLRTSQKYFVPARSVVPMQDSY